MGFGWFGVWARFAFVLFGLGEFACRCWNSGVVSGVGFPGDFLFSRSNLRG